MAPVFPGAHHAGAGATEQDPGQQPTRADRDRGRSRISMESPWDVRAEWGSGGESVFGEGGIFSSDK